MLKKNLLLLIGLAFFAWAIFAFLHAPRAASQAKLAPVTSTSKSTKAIIGNTAINIEIAETDETRMQGLSGRSTLAEDTGMLFVFPHTGKFGFWMKDMLVPLDIIWIDENNRVIDIDKNLSPETYPTIFTPIGDVKYVLEMPANFSDAHTIQVGNSFSLDN